MDYALDLKYFHAASRDLVLVPILIATAANQSSHYSLLRSADLVTDPICLAPPDLAHLLEPLEVNRQTQVVDSTTWIQSPYSPTPTIVEAAQTLYRGHGVEDISRNDAAAENLTRTASVINRIIDSCKAESKKAICLVTGVPGSGKTLAGLTIANERHQFEEEEHAVFLSGNGPLVKVLREALARDDNARTGVNKKEALRKSSVFIQNIYHFRDDALGRDDAPIEKVAVFDEAQRAWDSDQLSKFMKEKKGIAGFTDTEPEFLIGVMDRHQDWAVIVCLIGEGQEINTGEAGIGSWLDALTKRFTDWEVHTSPRVLSESYNRGARIDIALEELGTERVSLDNSLHLDVSVRSFRSERLSDFIHQLLENQKATARDVYGALRADYPIVLTRNLDSAKQWVRSQARGTERYGKVASSGARRLRPFGIWVQAKTDPVNWFLNDSADSRSSYGLEETATEFDVQGLELDWTIVCWDGDLRYEYDGFRHYRFRGKEWQRVNQVEQRVYLVNAYRVLLTRARQGMVIFVPEGDERDITRSAAFYDHTFEYLAGLGIPVIE